MDWFLGKLTGHHNLSFKLKYFEWLLVGFCWVARRHMCGRDMSQVVDRITRFGCDSVGEARSKSPRTDYVATPGLFSYLFALTRCVSSIDSCFGRGVLPPLISFAPVVILLGEARTRPAPRWIGAWFFCALPFAQKNRHPMDAGLVRRVERIRTSDLAPPRRAL